ncbi:Peptidase family M20/M25/M40 [Pleurostoma richardsiae]|uniref:Peptidase family M20/M25/M40 n=1 Tax=Pleurostoma richardsiae TaxID=41990 RepID=A0AA38RSR6_9PEZI|nr:Peptidase family M20/M25/M40 [Pleurostoma richardsiae]
MLTSEKLPLVEGLPVGGRPAPQSCSSSSRTVRRCAVLLASALCLSAASYNLMRSVTRVIPGHQSPALADQCPQVAPLTPSQRTSALSEMDSYFDTVKFRNETVARMAGAIQIPSQSYDDMGPIGEDPRWDVMYDVAAYLEKTFPLVHSTLTLEKVNTHGLLYTWQGSDASLKPTVLMAHQDVVPVAEATVGQWTHPPFSGAYDGKYVWGRGASDCKNSLIGIFEAVELLIDAGFEPKRTTVLSFGFDEEVSGPQGAGHLAPFLLERYGKDGAAVIVDEGGSSYSGWGTVFAAPGVGEKGYIDVDIIVRMPGGHSSVPPDHNGIGVMSELITLIEANRYEPHFTEENPFLGLMQCGAAHSPDFPKKLEKLLPSWKEAPDGHKDELALETAKLGPAVKYLFTTSVAVDIIGGGVKVNALPERTKATVNHRVNVGSHPSVVQDRLTLLAGKIADKYNLTLNAFTDEPETPSSIVLKVAGKPLEPAPVTPTSVDGVTPYGILSGTTRALYGEDIIMAPGIMTGNTDTKFYWDLTKHIFRYVPGWDDEQAFMDGVHTVNEKLSVLAHTRNVKWFSMFIRNMDEADLA